MNNSRPKYLDIPHIRFPAAAIISIMHRISGIALFLFLPFFLWILSGSLSSQDQFETYQNVVGNPLIKIILTLLLWGYMHHVFAGVRFLFLDVHKGIQLEQSRKTAKFVGIGAFVFAMIMGVICIW